MRNRVISLMLTMCILLSCFAVGTFTQSSAASVDYGLADNVQDGQILQCWNWSYNNIKNNMALIAEQGFSAVQTSPIQASKESTKEWYSTMSNSWWVYYQPISFEIETNSYNALGTKTEFTAMCTEAHKYGVKVIVDAVLNHLANSSANVVHSSVPSDIKDDSNCWRNLKTNISNYENRYDVTHYCLDGLPELNTGSSKIQTYVADFLKECIDCGADGFRFDAARHIETPGDASGTRSDFWPNVLNAATSHAQSTRGITPYYYGEILDSLSGLDVNCYTTYMSITDNKSSNSIRNNVASGNAQYAASSGINFGSAANKTVQWNESHDTYASGGSNNVSDSNINKTWAIVGSRADVCSMYLARPASNSDMLGTAGITAWANPEVKAVNKFKNLFVGQSEYMSYSGSIAYVERGASGAVLVNVGGNSTKVSVPAHTIANGTYSDAITGNTFTVSNGTISGTIGSTGIAVVYNQPPTATVTPGTSSYRTDTLTLTLNYANATRGQYSIDGGSYKTFTNGQQLTIGSDVAYGGTTTVKVKATDGSTTLGENTYVYTKMDPTEEIDIYFDNSAYGWDYVYAYFYDPDTGKEATPWPGVKMTLDGDTDYNITQIPLGFEGGRVIFNDNGSTQVPASGQEGFKLSSEILLFQSGSLGTFSPTALYGFSGTLYLSCYDWAYTGGNVSLQAYVWNGENNAWVEFTDPDGDQVFSATLPEGEWKRVQFCRVNPGGSSTDTWDNVWNQTDVYTFREGCNMFTVNAGEWNDATGSWSTYGGGSTDTTTATQPTTATTASTADEKITVSLAGTFNDWSTIRNPLSATTGNVVSTTVTLEAGTYEFKIVEGTEWYGKNNSTINDSTDNGSTGWSLATNTSNIKLVAGGGTYTFNYNTYTNSLVVEYTPSETEATEATASSSTTPATTFLAGSFNGWNTTATPMYTTSNNIVSTTLVLENGTYEFKIVENGSWYGNNGTIADTTTATSSIGWRMETSAGNCTLKASGGTYKFQYNTSTNMLFVFYSATVETEPTETTPVRALGDVDGDGEIDINDVTHIQKILARLTVSTPEALKYGDVDGNGKLSIRDVTYIQMYVAKYIGVFPA